MPAQTIHFVQQYERKGKRLVMAQQLPFKTAEDAKARAGRDAGRFAGVIAVSQTVDTDTGEVLDEPVALAHHGETPMGTAD